jgi:hypothetical protein
MNTTTFFNILDIDLKYLTDQAREIIPKSGLCQAIYKKEENQRQRSKEKGSRTKDQGSRSKAEDFTLHLVPFPRTNVPRPGRRHF